MCIHLVLEDIYTFFRLASIHLSIYLRHVIYITHTTVTTSIPVSLYTLYEEAILRVFLIYWMSIIL